MNLSKDVTETGLTIRVEEDRIDAAVAIQFKDTFRALIEGSDGPVIMDLGRVEFLDSSGLGAVVAARKLLGAERELNLGRSAAAGGAGDGTDADEHGFSGSIRMWARRRRRWLWPMHRERG